MKITSSLMGWLARTQSPPQAQTQVSQKSHPDPVKDDVSRRDSGVKRGPGTDKVNLSETALQMSQDDVDPQISAEEKEALNQAFQSPTYKVSMAQIAKRVINKIL